MTNAETALAWPDEAAISGGKNRQRHFYWTQMNEDNSSTSYKDEDLFPSGPWAGYYIYKNNPLKHRMNLRCDFKNGRIDGDGLDDIGPFFISGTYSRESLECKWIKRYPGSHSVDYKGYREGRGIWGIWQIENATSGGFHIWPRGIGKEEELIAEDEEPSFEEFIGSSPRACPITKIDK